MKRTFVNLILMAMMLSVQDSNACDTCQRAREALFSQEPKLVDGMGPIEMPVSTDNKEAQCFFDQGLSYLYAYNHDEAVRNFEQALKLDPKLAMAHWGIAYAVGPNYNLPADSAHLAQAYAEVQMAKGLAAEATGRERDYITAIEKRYAADPKSPRGTLDSAYWTAMRAVAMTYPDDVHARALYVESAMNLRPWKLWNNDGTPAPGTEEIVSILEDIMERQPGHTGANHFYIHCVEASPDPERGLMACARLDTLAPDAGHLVHMPAHIYARAGDYARSEKSNADGMMIDEKYLSTAPPGSMYELMYYHHNIHFLAVAQLIQGKYSGSLASAEKLEKSVSKYINEVPMLEGLYMTSILCQVRFNRWSEILASPKPAATLPTVTALWHYARATALVSTGKYKEAKKEYASYRKVAATVAPEATIGFLNSALNVFRITDDVLSARILMIADGKIDSAITLLRRAVEVEDELQYDEPEGWYIPVREMLGVLLLKNADPAGAEEVFRAELKKHKRSGRALFGLREALKAQGDMANAQFVDQELQIAWRNADAPLKIEDLL